MKPALAVVGSLNMDFVVSVARLPAPGETALGSDFRMVPGGKGANQACAAGKLGAGSVDVRMIGRVGYDVFADHLRASLAAAGVDTSFIHSSRAQATGIALIWVDRNGQNSIVVVPGANGALAASDVEAMRRAIRGASHVLFQLEIPLDTVAAALALAREEGAVTILDPAPARDLSPELLALVDILTPNESEAAALVGSPGARVTPSDASEVARRLLRMGPRSVVLKLGENGCFHHDGNAGTHYPAFPVRACDTTAAGDTFNAAMAVMLAERRPMAQALRFASAAAAISVTRLGAQSSIPTRVETDRFLALASGA